MSKIEFILDCSICHLILDSGTYDNLETLVATNVEKCDYGYVCLLCSKTIHLRQNMRNHMREQHMKPREYKCPPCGLVFKNREFYKHVGKFHPDWRGIDFSRFRIDP